MSENVSEIMSEKITDRWVISRNDNADMMSGEEKRFLMESTIFTELEKTRLNRLIQYMIKFQSINSAKAEKNHLLESEGRTKNKIYRLKHVF